LGAEYKSLSSSLTSFLFSFLPLPSYAQIFPSESYSQIPSAYVPPERPSFKPYRTTGKIIFCIS
jgi:hypothetical protein